MAKYIDLLHRILSKKGLPLFEIIMVLIIFSLHGMLCLGGVFRSEERSKVEINDKRMIRLNMALQTYKWVNNSFPPTLGALICEGQDKRSCILVAAPELLRDAWGTPYLHQVVGDGFTIKSMGADKREGGDGPNADITLEGP